MNTNPNAITVLCYGDSNTHGQKPDKTGRYEANVRWTGVLQDLLGNNYYVIEEGLGSRTTDLDYDKKPGRNGKFYLAPCLHSHDPIDIVVIMLGTNDLKSHYNRSVDEIAKALGGLVDDCRTYGETKTGKTPTVILVSPIVINEQAPHFHEFYSGSYDKESGVKSEGLSDSIRKVGSEKDVLFIDAATVSKPGGDGIHIDQQYLRPLGELLAQTILSLT